MNVIGKNIRKIIYINQKENWSQDRTFIDGKIGYEVITNTNNLVVIIFYEY